MSLLHEEITKEIIGAAYEVHNILGYGFLEKVYRNAMQVELIRRGLTAETEHWIKVIYKDALVGEYSADLFVAGCVIVELKALKEYHRKDEAQLINELKGSEIKVGMLINFGRERVEYKRIVF
jgi:GxxExxY protein